MSSEEDDIDYDSTIKKLKNHSKRIRTAHQVIENAHSALDKRVAEVAYLIIVIISAF
jgi:hypothetical protein